MVRGYAFLLSGDCGAALSLFKEVTGCLLVVMVGVVGLAFSAFGGIEFLKLPKKIACVFASFSSSFSSFFSLKLLYFCRCFCLPHPRSFVVASKFGAPFIFASALPIPRRFATTRTTAKPKPSSKWPKTANRCRPRPLR